jgi:hypothetical protein
VVTPVYCILIRFVRVYYGKEYGYYLARSSINVAINVACVPSYVAVNKNEAEKINYLILGIESYNKYLQKNLEL